MTLGTRTVIYRLLSVFPHSVRSPKTDSALTLYRTSSTFSRRNIFTNSLGSYVPIKSSSLSDESPLKYHGIKDHQFPLNIRRIQTESGNQKQNMATLTALPDVEQLSDRVWRILGCNPGPYTLQGTNTFIVGTGKKRILIDAGEADRPNYLTNLKKVLSEQSIEIDQLIITHWHGDHIGGVPELCQSVPNCPKTVMKLKRRSEPDVTLENGIAYKFIEDGHVFKTEGATLRALYTPGHTDDHMCLVLEEDNIIFSGDTVLGEGTAVFEDLYEYMKSLEKILGLKPSVVYPSHGSVVTDPESHLKMYISHRNARGSQIMKCLQNAEKALTGMEIVKIVYHNVPEHLHPGALGNVRHHLGKLVKENRVEVVINGPDDKKYRALSSHL